MFRLRENTAEVAFFELIRQKRIYDLIINPKNILVDNFDKLAASILDLPVYDPLVVSNFFFDPKKTYEKINFDNLPLNSETINELQKIATQEPDIWKQTFKFPKPFNLFDNSNVNFKNEHLLKKSEISSLYEFERIFFNNEIISDFINIENFANYLKTNLIYYLQNHPNSKMQEHMYQILENTENDNNLAVDMFYESQIEYGGKMYFTNTIKKYNVKALENLNLNRPKYDQIQIEKTLKYVTSTVLNENTEIPLEHLKFYKIFPFQKGKIVESDGKIKYLNISKPKRINVETTIKAICNERDLESAIYSLTFNESYDEILSFAVHAENINHQGIALLTLRGIVGNILTFNSYSFKLPTLNDVLMWIKLKCEETNTLVLPKSKEEGNIENYVNLIKYIAYKSKSKLDVSFLVSKYFLPECYYERIFDELQTDLEKYIFCALILQNYNKFSYKKYQNNLNPVFNATEIKMSEKEMKNLESKLPIIKTNSLNNTLLIEPASLNFNMPFHPNTIYYEFSNSQLKNLCKNEKLILTPFQKCTLLSFYV